MTLDQGGGSKGKDVSGELVGTTYTVCEVPIANPPNAGGTSVNLTGVPVPTGSNETVDPRYPLSIRVLASRLKGRPACRASVGLGLAIVEAHGGNIGIQHRHRPQIPEMR